MGTLVLPFGLVPDSNLHKLKRALSSAYDVKQIKTAEDQLEKYLITTEWNYETKEVATVTVVGKQFVFDYADDAFSLNYFLDWIKRRCLNNDLLWLVLFPHSANTWTFIGVPEKTKEAALKWVNVNMMDRMSILVSFFPSDRVGRKMMVKSANYLKGSWPKVEVDDKDVGAVGFYIYEWEGQ